jgi:hypothetical protein
MNTSAQVETARRRLNLRTGYEEARAINEPRNLGSLTPDFIMFPLRSSESG